MRLRSCLAASVQIAICFNFLPHDSAKIASAETTAAHATDPRLGELNTLDGYFPFEVPESLTAWEQRAERVRRQIRVALGLWPEPTRTPLNAVIHGKVDQPDFTVDRVYFESFPGHFVTGSLFRPKNKQGRLPAVLSPHGHWADGRFHDAGRETVLQQIKDGAEQFEDAGRYPLQARCVQLARMGCVVFHYDMVGYADSQQIPLAVAHQFHERRSHMESDAGWGFYSPQAELRLQNIMGLQAWNSLRALDWLCSLPDVDSARIAVTGASGGGTQTFILGAIDPRPTAIFPAVMVSTAMQGGCTCENAPYLRIGTGNVEFAALFAPKPLGMSAANDWTREIAAKGLPELKRLYRLFGAQQNVAATVLLEFGHNYNYPSRAAMYAWFNNHLRLGVEEPIVEKSFEPLSRAELTVWNDEHPPPPGGEAHERALLQGQWEDAQRRLANLVPRDSRSLAEYRRVVGGAWDILIGRTLPEPGEITLEQAASEDRGDYIALTGTLHHRRYGERVAIVCLQPKRPWKQVVVWVEKDGADTLQGDDGQPKEHIRKLLAEGAAIVAIDPFTPPGPGSGKPPRGRRVENHRNFVGYTAGYNHPLFSQRVHDVLAAIAFVRDQPKRSGARIALAGMDGGGVWAAAARVQAEQVVSHSAIDTAGFRFDALNETDDADFLPGAVKYGDVPGLLAVGAHGPLWLASEGATSSQLIQAAHNAQDGATVTIFDDADTEKTAAAVRWLLAQ
jgi:dienelactone hydrolase